MRVTAGPAALLRRLERGALMASAADLEEERIRSAYARRCHDSRYSLFQEGQLFLIQERERRVLALLKRRGYAELADCRILEIGTGTGSWLREFIKWGARPENITGLDLLPARVAEAKHLCPAT